MNFLRKKLACKVICYFWLQKKLWQLPEALRHAHGLTLAFALHFPAFERLRSTRSLHFYAMFCMHCLRCSVTLSLDILDFQTDVEDHLLIRFTQAMPTLRRNELCQWRHDIVSKRYAAEIAALRCKGINKNTCPQTENCNCLSRSFPS